jgi:hypothetical protein
VTLNDHLVEMFLGSKCSTDSALFDPGSSAVGPRTRRCHDDCVRRAVSFAGDLCQAAARRIARMGDQPQSMNGLALSRLR